jgi:hypothetical protein
VASHHHEPMVATWKFLHVICMFGAVAVLMGGGLLRNVLLHSGDVAAVRQALAAERRLANRVGAPLLLAGVAFGFVTAVQMGFPLLSTWLVLAYGLLALNLFNGALLYERHAKRLESAALAAVGSAPSTELVALIRSPRTWLLNAVDGFLWVALVWTMVTKPFS